ncbi:histidine kinase [Natronococcus wangiae]|uniref:histidine kinase n=1 Tax=Natronococcus wangiae TaxID=3068275 RepID=UPI00273F297E|nr:histidine kinase [Natronococcus sp. AD5]
MASKVRTRTDERTGTALEPWQAGTVGGIAGAIVFGAMMTAQSPAVLEMGIPAMYGLEGGLAGWILHVSHGAVIGVVFAALLVATGQSHPGVVRSTALGLAYGVVVWVVLAVVVMPIWLSAVGFPMAPPLPNVDVGSLMGHGAYGLVLGAVYALLER